MKIKHGDKGKDGSRKALEYFTLFNISVLLLFNKMFLHKGFLCAKKEKKEMSCTFVACTLGGSSKGLNH